MKTIFLSAGHSETDPGAIAHGRREADIAVEFRNIVSWYLQRAKARYALDATGTGNIPLPAAAKLARKYPIAVEIHCNAGPRTATGVEALSGSKDTQLSEALCAAVSGALGIRNRGAKPEGAGQHKRLAFVQAGGIILELLFITNESDLSAYDARKWLAAKAVADALMAAAN